MEKTGPNSKKYIETNQADEDKSVSRPMSIKNEEEDHFQDDGTIMKKKKEEMKATSSERRFDYYGVGGERQVVHTKREAVAAVR